MLRVVAARWQVAANEEKHKKAWKIDKNFVSLHAEKQQVYSLLSLINTNYKMITPISQVFDFEKVPSWYPICFNDDCPLKDECMRHLAAQHLPETTETACCVMKNAQADGKCRWFDKITVVVKAAGFSHLFDRVMKKDYTTMRKTLTQYLHGTRIYYECMRGERALSPKEQQWIINYVKSMGYDWEVTFDRYFVDYEFHDPTKRSD